MKTEKWFLSAIWRLYFHNAKFDNFKDEKMSDKKKLSQFHNQKLAGLKTC